MRKYIAAAIASAGFAWLAGAAPAQSQKEDFLNCAAIKTDIMECLSPLSAPFNLMIRRDNGSCWLGSEKVGQTPVRLTCDEIDYTDLGPRHWFVIDSQRNGFLELSTVGFNLLGLADRSRAMYFDNKSGPSFGRIAEPDYRPSFNFRRSVGALTNPKEYPSNQALMYLRTGGFPDLQQMVVASGAFAEMVFLKADPEGSYGEDQKTDGVDIVPIANAAGGGLFMADQRNTAGTITRKEAQADLEAFAQNHRLVMSANFTSPIYPIQTVSIQPSSPEIGLTMRRSDSTVAWDHHVDEVTLIRAPAGGHNGANEGELYLHGGSSEGAIVVMAVPDHLGLVYLKYAPKDGGPRSDVCRTGGEKLILCDTGDDPHTFRLFQSRQL